MLRLSLLTIKYSSKNIRTQLWVHLAWIQRLRKSGEEASVAVLVIETLAEQFIGFVFLVDIGRLLFNNEGVFVDLDLVGFVDGADHRLGRVEEFEEILLWFGFLLKLNVET